LPIRLIHQANDAHDKGPRMVGSEDALHQRVIPLSRRDGSVANGIWRAR
jgi:hypothetical protein